MSRATNMKFKAEHVEIEGAQNSFSQKYMLIDRPERVGKFLYIPRASYLNKSVDSILDLREPGWKSIEC